MAAEVAATAAAAAETGIQPVAGPIVQVSTATRPDAAADRPDAAVADNVVDVAVESVISDFRAATLTGRDASAATASKGTGKAATPEGTDAAATSKDTAAAGSSAVKCNAKGPTFKITARNSFTKASNSKAKYNGKQAVAKGPTSRKNVAQDLVKAAAGATARADIIVKVLKTGTGHEVLNAGEYYYKISTIRWKCGFIENGCYYWLCMMNPKTLCQSTIKTTIIDGKHCVVKDNHRNSGMKHNHVPEPHAEVLIALLRGD